MRQNNFKTPLKAGRNISTMFFRRRKISLNDWEEEMSVRGG